MPLPKDAMLYIEFLRNSRMWPHDYWISLYTSPCLAVRHYGCLSVPITVALCLKAFICKCPKMEEAVDVLTGSLHVSHASFASPERVIMDFCEFDMRTLR